MSLDNQIYISRDKIRTQVIEKLQEYLELENVDLVKSSFLSFIIDTISTMTSNLLFYQTSVHREFFLTKAQLSESVLNLASFLGYTPQTASYSTVDVLITIPFGFADSNTTFSIPESFQFKAGEVIFEPYYDTTITVTNNSAVNVQVNDDGRIYNMPVNIDTTANNEFSFILPLKQYKTTTQEFQLDADLQLYQFSEINVPFDGKISDIEVHVKEPGADPSDSGRLYSQFNSLYLMSSTDYGYVYRRTNEGCTVYFGNGLIGMQPTAGSTIIVDIIETEGAEGNIIAGSITEGDRIYTQQGGVTQIVNYTVTNVSPAVGGDDEEDLEDTRKNAISNLTSLNRLVSEDDYQNIDVVVPESPLGSNSIPVLKRSDVKTNEIQLYTTLQYDSDIVPMRNCWFDSTASISYIPRGEVVNIDSEDYYTIFDMTLDNRNSAAYYHYIMYEIDTIPVLVQSWSSNPYEIHGNNLNVTKVGNSAVFSFSYYSTESDYNLCDCEMGMVSSDGVTYTMTNNPGTDGGTFDVTITPYTALPDGNVDYFFRISNPSGLIAEYSASLVFRQDLREFMLSNTVVDSTADIVTIYDVPVVQKEFYDSIVQKDFELLVLQKMLQSMDFVNYRMLTDFTNVKFTNTTGKLKLMKLNVPTKSSVIDIGISSIPTMPSVGDAYIVTGYEGGEWADHRNDIAICDDATAVTWAYLTPRMDETIYVQNKDTNYIFTGSGWGWISPEYNIPLDISLEVVRAIDAPLDAELMQSIKDALIDTFESRFGSNIYLYRSEIIDVVQEVEGVNHCRLIKPESNIFFNADLRELTQQQLLEYAPDYVYFTEDTITIKLLESA